MLFEIIVILNEGARPTAHTRQFLLEIKNNNKYVDLLIHRSQHFFIPMASIIFICMLKSVAGSHLMKLAIYIALVIFTLLLEADFST